ncbi:hypothetical protein ACFYY8_24175 [Streptosporangium sp. NPDC001559]|uniref:Peptidase inhibitor family I36 n=1 Tax=Streptosporangium jomthongense TaxID=1193683 RepID=A0ABV8F694_9ACTN
MLASIVGAAAAATALLSPHTAMAADSTPIPASADVSALSPQQLELLKSDAPHTISVDPRTGKVLSVTEGAISTPAISQHNICNSGDFCYASGQVPYAHQGFYGSAGTKTGSWPSRSYFDTGNYRGRACWTYQGSSPCSGPWGPNSYVNFNGSLVTGTSVTLY